MLVSSASAFVLAVELRELEELTSVHEQRQREREQAQREPAEGGVAAEAEPAEHRVGLRVGGLALGVAQPQRAARRVGHGAQELALGEQAVHQRRLAVGVAAHLARGGGAVCGRVNVEVEMARTRSTGGKNEKTSLLENSGSPKESAYDPTKIGVCYLCVCVCACTCAVCACVRACMQKNRSHQAI